MANNALEAAGVSSLEDAPIVRLALGGGGNITALPAGARLGVEAALSISLALARGGEAAATNLARVTEP